MIDRISRRSMLTGAVAAGAASLASSVVSAAPATKWDETVAARRPLPNTVCGSTPTASAS